VRRDAKDVAFTLPRGENCSKIAQETKNRVNKG